MKKLFALILVVIGLCGCTDSEVQHPDGFYKITKIEFEGHSYVTYHNSVGVVQGFTHDPDCKCIKKR